MERYEWVISPQEPGGRLSTYLCRALPLLPEHAIRDALENKDVRLDGVRVKADAEIKRGATVCVYTPYQTVLPIVFENDEALIINKPSGLCTDDESVGMTVLSLAKRAAGERYTPRLCHRLDTQTSGLMILAKTDLAEEKLLSAFKHRTLTKEYECLVKGEMRPAQADIKAFLFKDALRGRVRVIAHETPGSRPIETVYRTLSFDGSISRLRVELVTGRTHQIRAHMAYLSHPILGDDVYGDRAFNRREHAVGSLKLCAVMLKIHAGTGLEGIDEREFSVKAPF